ncbi:MAG: DUF4401 domain-containing protein [Cystobacter sp.]
MAFKPSLREVLPPEAWEPARAVLASQPEGSGQMPWFIRVLAGGGAWLSALFLTVFLILLVPNNRRPTALVMSLIIITAAVLMRTRSTHVFATQFTLSIGLAGQGFFIVGVANLTREETLVALAIVLLQGALLVITPDLLQRFLSALFASLALLYVVRQTLPEVGMDMTLVAITALAHVLFLQQGTWQSRPWGERVTPLAFGLTTTLFTALIIRTWFHEAYARRLHSEDFVLPPGVLTLGLAAVTLYSAWRVMKDIPEGPQGAAEVTLLAGLALLAVVTLDSPGVIAALGVLMLGFHRRAVVLIGMAVIFVLVFGVSHYYDMKVSLLAKSLSLMGSGLLLLGARLFLLRRPLMTGEAT